MARDILGEFGPDHHHTTHSAGDSGLTHDGGKPHVKSKEYHHPVGPLDMHHEKPGLGGGAKAGHGQKFTTHDESTGSVGNHGTVHHCGSQGRH